MQVAATGAMSRANLRASTLWTVGCAVLMNATMTTAAGAQTPPPPLWDTQVGASFVGTSGNSDTTTAGADFGLHRRWPSWQIEAVAAAVRATSSNVKTAERYLGAFRAQRKLTSIVALSVGERAERDQLAGIDLRSILDGGLNWTLIRAARLSLDAVTSVAWEHEGRTIGPSIDHPVGLLQVSSRIPLGASADTTQRFAYYPDFQESSAYRSEVEIAAQADMNGHLALRIGYLRRYSHQPVPGFKKSDGLATASLVVHWHAATPAP